jgi:NADH:ubiquinone oxidoreductase subunit F (NADH-binding)
LKNDRRDDLTCFASQKGSKRYVIVGKEKRVGTKIICKIYKAVKSCDIFDIPFGCLLFEILESEGKYGQYSSIFMGPIHEEMQRQHTYHILT